MYHFADLTTTFVGHRFVSTAKPDMILQGMNLLRSGSRPPTWLTWLTAGRWQKAGQVQGSSEAKMTDTIELTLMPKPR
jgi:hypothetical protein